MTYICEVPPSSYSRTTFRELLHGFRIKCDRESQVNA